MKVRNQKLEPKTQEREREKRDREQLKPIIRCHYFQKGKKRGVNPRPQAWKHLHEAGDRLSAEWMPFVLRRTDAWQKLPSPKLAKLSPYIFIISFLALSLFLPGTPSWESQCPGLDKIKAKAADLPWYFPALARTDALKLFHVCLNCLLKRSRHILCNLWPIMESKSHSGEVTNTGFGKRTRKWLFSCSQGFFPL